MTLLLAISLSLLAGLLLGAEAARRWSRSQPASEMAVLSHLNNQSQTLENIRNYIHSSELKLAELRGLQGSISELTELFRLPHLRGRMGEQTLEQVLSANLTPDQYELQAPILPSGGERVDALIRLPDDTYLPIDSKFPREQVSGLYRAETRTSPVKLEEARAKLREILKREAREIRAKYIRPEYQTAELALLFLPSELLYFETSRDLDLMDDLQALRVFPCSPNTLSIALQAVRLGNDRLRAARELEQTLRHLKLAESQLDQTERKFQDLGRLLERAQESYRQADQSLKAYRVSTMSANLDSPLDAAPSEARGAAPEPRV